MTSTKLPRRIHLALRHDRVLGRRGEEIHSSVTQTDLHDFCRLTLTYGLAGFHCVTEMEAQHRLCSEILDFWRAGYGKSYNPDRVAALESLHIHRSFDDLVTAVTNQDESAPLIIGTSAKPCANTIDFTELFPIIESSGRSAIIQFGTSWGLSESQLNRCDRVLPPIDGYDGYNHLSVRCAAAIIVDRLVLQGRIKH